MSFGVSVLAMFEKQIETFGQDVSYVPHDTDISPFTCRIMLQNLGRQDEGSSKVITGIVRFLQSDILYPAYQDKFTTESGQEWTMIEPAGETNGMSKWAVTTNVRPTFRK